MVRVCHSCGAEPGDDARYCPACGAPLVRDADPPPAAERRHVTVMFCDMVDSTGISSRLDPEDLRDLVALYQGTASEAIRRRGGHVAQYLGDGVLAYFGHPVADEDDARRAVMAGLDITARVRGLGKADVAARVAVHTGSAVIGPVAPGSPANQIMGLAPNVAARLQACAEPNTVIVSADTADLVSGYFELEPLGAFELKGIDTPTAAFRPARSLDHVSRLDRATARGLTPLAGRRLELDALTSRWRAALDGASSTVLLRGDPGIGKSRLVWELRQRLAGAGHDVVALRCSPIHASRPLHPVLEHLAARLGADRDQAVARLRAWIQSAGLPRQPALTLVGELLGLPVLPDPELAEGIELRREMALGALRELVAGGTERPRLLVVEDLQWADPSTLAFVAPLTRAGARPLMLLCTARREFRAPWPEAQVITIDRLGTLAAREIVTALAGDGALDDAVVAAVAERSDGIPLFAEELTRLVVRQGPDASPDAIPETLHDLLVGRIDALGPVKPVLQTASVIGREFEVDLLAAVHPGGADRGHVLDQLRSSDLVLTGAEGACAFRHVLIRDAAYSTLLRSERRALHERLARALMIAEAPEDVIAYHCAEAGLVAEAIEHWHAAATGSMAAGANAEAVAFVDRALELAAVIPEGPERAQAELLLLTARGPALMAQLGYGHPDVAETFGRAKVLCDALGNPVEVFPVLYGLVAYSAVRCDLGTASELAAVLRERAEGTGDPGLLMLAHAASAQTLFIRGDFRRALDEARACAAHQDAGAREEYRMLFGEDPGTVCAGVEAWLEWLVGRPREAAAQMERTIAAARTLNHQFTLAETLLIASRLRHYSDDVAGVRATAAEALAIAERHGFPLFEAEGQVWTAWADAVERRDPGACARLRAGLDAYRASGAEMFVPHHLVLLAETQRVTGDLDRALATIAEARERAAALGNLDHQVEALRLSAVLLAEARPADREVGRLLDEAAALAAEQGAVTFAARVDDTRARVGGRSGTRVP